jgi:anti-sigma factor RsiW
MNPMNHVQALNTLASERYLLGEMTELERHAFEDHFFSCHECADDVRAGALMRDGARAGFVASPTARPVDASISAFRPRASRRLSIVLPWAAAAALSGVAAYQSLWVLPELRRQAAPQTLAPIMLRPATRGTDPVVRVLPGRPITLAIDVNAPESSSELSYALQRATGGATVLTGQTPVPVTGTPLLLLFPSSVFPEPGRYTLRFTDTTNPNISFGEYRFVVETN